MNGERQRPDALGGTHAPQRIGHDEPVGEVTSDAQVIVRPGEGQAVRKRDIFEVLQSLPPGKRTKEDIDRQMAEEQDLELTGRPRRVDG